MIIDPPGSKYPQKDPRLCCRQLRCDCIPLR
jgi:hypothetical protein